jgi:excisionase family DNA binding protein
MFTVGQMSRRTAVPQHVPVHVNESNLRMAMRPLLVSSAAAAEVLGIGRTTLYEIVKSGALTPIHLRRCVRFSMVEIEQLVESLIEGERTAGVLRPPRHGVIAA